MNKLIKLWLFLLALVFSVPAFAEAPNFIIIVSDDQRYDDVDGVMPITLEKVFNKGLRFDQAMVTTPACCPSRAGIFTGQYDSVNKVIGNRYKLKTKTLFQRLQGQYYLGHIGKYLNSYDGKHLAEYDYWVSKEGGRAEYYDPKLYIQSAQEIKKVTGYSTDLFRDYALDFLTQADKQSKPFGLVLAFVGPHEPAIPAKIDQEKFKDLSNPSANFPSFGLTREDKIKNLSPKWTWDIQNPPLQMQALAQKQRATLQSVDRAVGSVIDKLTEINSLENTIIFYISDNGLFRGEHGLRSKDAAYEEAVKVPLAIRYDRLISAPRRDSSLVANIDIAPTIYELATGSALPEACGQSLSKLFKSPVKDFRQELLLEGWSPTAELEGRTSRRPFAAIRTPELKYIRNASQPGESPEQYLELYNLKTDPYEVKNLFLTKEYQAVVKDLDVRLDKLLMKYRGSTRLDLQGVSGTERLPGKDSEE